ncbi:DUF3558 domain-containing protein [Amycolatopsis sp. NPDC052450]|uniref:DUF3558 domain-containing protein n=1 Tax=Amycolatopsis sp. NPDC052450 TaxID=3363937 RepID=UPI0037C884C9
MKPRLSQRLAMLIVGGLVVLAGCGTSPPPPPPEPSVSVPPIPAQLNGAKFKADPCTAITVEQLQSIGFSDNGTKQRGRDGECVVAFGRSVEVTASWHPVLEANISTLYRDHARGRHNSKNWEEVTINGYPAVITEIEENIPTKKDEGPLACRLALGVDDATLVYVGANTRGRAEAGPWRNDPCGAAKKISEFVLYNLRS